MPSSFFFLIKEIWIALKSFRGLKFVSNCMINQSQAWPCTMSFSRHHKISFPFTVSLSCRPSMWTLLDQSDLLSHNEFPQILQTPGDGDMETGLWLVGTSPTTSCTKIHSVGDVGDYWDHSEIQHTPCIMSSHTESYGAWLLAPLHPQHHEFLHSKLWELWRHAYQGMTSPELWAFSQKLGGGCGSHSPLLLPLWVSAQDVVVCGAGLCNNQLKRCCRSPIHLPHWISAQEVVGMWG